MASLHERHLLCDDGNANGIQKENQKEQQVWLQTRRKKVMACTYHEDGSQTKSIAQRQEAKKKPEKKS